MNELIPIQTNEKDEQVVSGRALHEFLEIETPYTQWFDRMVEYGFTENVDFVTVNELSQKSEGSRMVTRELINHAIRLNMAKELSMIQRNDRGKQARLYFIRVEEDWNSPEKLMARALRMADRQICALKTRNNELHTQIEADRPKTIFAEAVSASKTSILVGELAKLIKQNSVEIGQNRLFEQLREEGFLTKRRGTDYNMPTQRSMELGLFEIKETSIVHSDGHTTINKTPKVTGKGQVYFINMFINRRKLAQPLAR